MIPRISSYRCRLFRPPSARSLTSKWTPNVAKHRDCVRLARWFEIKGAISEATRLLLILCLLSRLPAVLVGPRCNTRACDGLKSSGIFFLNLNRSDENTKCLGNAFAATVRRNEALQKQHISTFTMSFIKTFNTHPSPKKTKKLHTRCQYRSVFTEATVEVKLSSFKKL